MNKWVKNSTKVRTTLKSAPMGMICSAVDAPEHGQGSAGLDPLLSCFRTNQLRDKCSSACTSMTPFRESAPKHFGLRWLYWGLEVFLSVFLVQQSACPALHHSRLPKPWLSQRHCLITVWMI